MNTAQTTGQVFSARRALHQDATAAEVTGELPLALFISANDDALGFVAQKCGWSGNLDAPELLPLGGCRAVFISPEIGGMGFEGVAAVTQHRENF